MLKPNRTVWASVWSRCSAFSTRRSKNIALILSGSCSLKRQIEKVRFIRVHSAAADRTLRVCTARSFLIFITFCWHLLRNGSTKRWLCCERSSVKNNKCQCFFLWDLCWLWRFGIWPVEEEYVSEIITGPHLLPRILFSKWSTMRTVNQKYPV